MAGYRWDPVVRVVPFNGSETVYWFADRLTDLGAHTKIALKYPETMKIHEDINRSLRPVVYGIRPEVEITCTIMSMADQLFLAEIESALLQPLDYAVYLSLDGGVVERQVVLSSGSVAEALKGKVYLGATFKLAMRCTDLIGTRPAMMTDPGTGSELTNNGDMEGWSGGAPLSWNGSSGVGTVAQEAAIIHGGASSARVTRSDGSTTFLFAQNAKRMARWGAWYRYQAYARSSIDLALSASGPFRVKILNIEKQYYLTADGKTWTAGNGNFIIAATLAASFTLMEGYFRIPSGFSQNDTMVVQHAGNWATGESLYYDDVSIYGPVLRAGYATW